MAKIIDCEGYVQELEANIKDEIIKNDIKANLLIINTNNDDASNVYIRNKIKKCKNFGLNADVIYFKKENYKDINEMELDVLKCILEANNNHNIHGIILQLPVQDGIDYMKLIDAIEPHKDVDGLSYYNNALLYKGMQSIYPATAIGIVKLLEYHNMELDGSNIVIVGRSILVGKPLFHLLEQRNATVTLAHSHTKDLSKITKKADIVICAIGIPKYFNNKFFKYNAKIIDVGINRDENEKLCGDVDFDTLTEKQECTIVPKGIGKITSSMVVYNLIQCYKISKYINR